MRAQKGFAQMNQAKQMSSSCALVLGTMLLLMVGMCWSANEAKDQSDIAKRIDASAKVLNEIMATPDKAIPNKVMSDAKCVAVIPSMVKVAVGFGGNHGKGVATCRTINSMECSCANHDHWSQLGTAAGRPGYRHRHDRDQRSGYATFVVTQVQARCRCFRCCWPSGPRCRC